MKWDAIPPEILIDCAQLTKANSIEGSPSITANSITLKGNKKDNITVIYTPWRNLHKQNGMATGQVGFHRQKEVRKVHVEKRINETINRLNKTRVERFPDLAKEKVDWEKEEKRKEKAALEEKVPPFRHAFAWVGVRRSYGLSVRRGRRRSGSRSRRRIRLRMNRTRMMSCMDVRLRKRHWRAKGKPMILRRISGEASISSGCVEKRAYIV